MDRRAGDVLAEHWWGRWWVQALGAVFFLVTALDIAREPALVGVIRVSFTGLFGLAGVLVACSAVRTWRRRGAAGPLSGGGSGPRR